MRQYINATRLLTKIRMLRSGKSRKVFILVEGITDYRLYNKFIGGSTCELIIADSKHNVIESIEACNREQMQGILGIVDADFWRLEQYQLNYENLFLTDFHDLECMLIYSLAYDHILTEYANRNKYLRFEERKKKPLKEILLENASKIGYLRWYSLKHNLGLRFNNLDFEKFTEPKELEVDLSKLVNDVLKRTKNKNELDTEEILKAVKALIKNQYSLWEVCCGHDIMELLTIGLVSIFGEYNAKNLFLGNLEGSFRLAYHKEYFIDTQLYKNLKKWEQASNTYVIFDGKGEI